MRTPSVPIVRIKKTPAGVSFKDLQVSGITSSGDPLYYFRYKTALNSIKYKVYIRAINDIYTTPFSVKLDFSPTSKYPKIAETQLSGFGYKAINPVANNPTAYDEIYMGDLVVSSYGSQYFFLACSTGASSAVPTALSLDYIKFVPFNN